NLGDLSDRLFRARSPDASAVTPGGGAAMPIHIENGSLQAGYRDTSGLRWVARAEGLTAEVVGGNGAVHAAHVRVELTGAAAQFSDARFGVSAGQVRRAEAEDGRLALAGAEDLL